MNLSLVLMFAREQIKFYSNIPMNIFAQFGAHFVPMAQCLICKQFWQKLFRVKSRWKNVVMILAAMFFGFSVFSTTLIPLMFGMVLYRERRSIVTRMMFSGILSKLLFFWSIYFNIFVMWQSTEQTTYLPGFPFL